MHSCERRLYKCAKTDIYIHNAKIIQSLSDTNQSASWNAVHTNVSSWKCLASGMAQVKCAMPY